LSSTYDGSGPPSNRKQRLKERRTRIFDDSSSDSSVNNTIPDFQALLRQFYKRGHPDLLRASHPDYATINDQSFQELNGILSSIKTPGEFPPAMIKSVPFYLKKNGAVSLSELHIRTSGGDCRKQLTKTFCLLFKDADVFKGDSFTWNKEYFPPAEKKVDDV
jgi:hypothetical protein